MIDEAAHGLAPTQQRGIVARIGDALVEQEKANITFIKAVMLGGGPMDPMGVDGVYRQLSPADQKAFQNGAAFTASTVASMLAPEALAALKIPGASTLIGKALAYETTQAAGGATFGAMQSLEPGQTRMGAIAGQAASQVVLGTIAGGLGLGLKGVLTKAGLMGNAVEKAVAQVPTTTLMSPELKTEAATVAASLPATRSGPGGTITRIDEMTPLGPPDRVTFPTNLEGVPTDQLLRGLFQRYDALPDRFATLWTRYDESAAVQRSSSGGGLSGAITLKMQQYAGKLEAELLKRGITPEQLDSGYSDYLEGNRAKGPPTPGMPPTETAGATGRVVMTPPSAPVTGTLVSSPPPKLSPTFFAGDLVGKSPDRIRAIHGQVLADEQSATREVFGADKAAQYEKAQRIVNSSTADPDSPSYKAATQLIGDLEGGLSDAQQRRLFGIGQAGLNAEDIRSAVGLASPGELKGQQTPELFAALGRFVGGNRANNTGTTVGVANLVNELQSRGLTPQDVNSGLVKQLRQRGLSEADAVTVAQGRLDAVQRDIAQRAGGPPSVPPPTVPPTAADVPHAFGGDGPPPSDSPLRALRQTLAGLRDNQLAGLSAAVDAAPILAKAPHLLGRTILGVSGASTIGYAQGKDDLDPGTRALMTGFGGLLLGASFAGSPTLKAAAQRIGLLRNTVGAIDGSALLTGGSKEALQSAVEISNLGKRAGLDFAETIDRLIPDKALNRAARYFLDEPNSPESAMFANRPDLMAHLAELRKLFEGYKTLLQNTPRLDGTPLLAEARENYLPRSGIVPREDLARFNIGPSGAGPKGAGLSSSAGFMQQRSFDTLRELETHLQANGLAPNDLSLGQLVGHYVATAQSVLGANAIKTELARVGLLLPGPGTVQQAAGLASLQFDNGVPWRSVRVSGIGNMVAPETVASALENMAKSPPSQWAGYLGDLKGLTMRFILANPLIHGVNLLRGGIAAGVSPSGFAQAWKAVANNDPSLMEAARYGLMTQGHADLLATSDRASQAFESVMKIPGGAMLKPLVALGGKAMEWSDRLLWQRMMPALAKSVYDLRMHKWGEATGGAFGVGSPEYITAARQAATFANHQAGQVPDMLRSPEFARLANGVLLAPRWLETRMRLSAGAAGEFTDVLTGELNPKNATYLRAKLRQAVVAVGVTYALSKMMTGQAPEWNERTSKYYARTNIDNGRGSQFGVDVLGWYQDDLRMWSAPMQFAAGKLNPLLRITGETVVGRDWAGRGMTTAERLENALNGLGGPLGQSATIGARAIAGGGNNVRSGLDAASLLTGAGTFAAMPRQFDVVIGNVAKKLLQQAAVPQSDDRVFELSRLLRTNAYRGQGLVNRGVLEYLAYQRRTAAEQRPLTTLWERGKQALRDLVH